MRATLVVVLLCVFAAAASAATMTPLSDSGLSAVSAGFVVGGPGGCGGSDDDLDVSVCIGDWGQENVTALNLINAGGPVQVGTNVLVACGAQVAAINMACVEQTVINTICAECSMCEFDDVDLRVCVKDEGQQEVSALNLINTTGSAQVGTNLVALCSMGGAAGVNKACLSQTVVNTSCQHGGGPGGLR